MPHVDRWVVQSVLSALGRGGLKLPPGRSVAINIAGQTLGDAEFLEFVVDCFDHTGASPGDICFEVTEGSVVVESGPCAALHCRVAWHGLRICSR